MNMWRWRVCYINYAPPDIRFRRRGVPHPVEHLCWDLIAQSLMGPLVVAELEELRFL